MANAFSGSPLVLGVALDRGKVLHSWLQSFIDMVRDFPWCLSIWGCWVEEKELVPVMAVHHLECFPPPPHQGK